MLRPPGRKPSVFPHPLTVWLTGVAVAMAMAGSTANAGWRIIVRGEVATLGETPLFARVDLNIPPGDYTLVPEKEGRPLRAHVFLEGVTTYLGTVLDSVPGSVVQTFRLVPDKDPDSARRGVQIRPQGRNLEVLDGDQPVLVYRADEATKPYYYPVHGPGGVPITRSYPMKDVPGEDRDHPHQRSLWFSHGNVNGYDFWGSDPMNKPGPKSGRITETDRKTFPGSAVGYIVTQDEWLTPGDQSLCSDRRVVRVFQTKTGRVLDFEVTIRANHGPVTFGDTKEGMFGIRVASSMDVKAKNGGKITNAEGLTDGATWGKASPWVDYTGPVAGKTVGITVFNHPTSFRYPTTWHVRDYGLFAANPFGWHDFGQKKSGEYTTPGAESIEFRYRVYLHEGGTDPKALNALNAGYQFPPA